jgi:hypothetical protein
MGVHVTFEIKLGEEHAAAGIALKSLHALMHLQMLIQIGPLCKCKVTVFFGTLEGTLTRVYPEMVEKVMPLFEGLIAVRVRAQQLLYDALGLGVFELENQVVGRAGDL